MFGTFEWERDNEKIVYGLVVDQVDHNLQRFARVVKVVLVLTQPCADSCVVIAQESVLPIEEH